MIVGSKLGTATNELGGFKISNVPVGTHSLRISSIGYIPVAKTDIVIRSKRITYVEVELKDALTELETITVSAGYFIEDDNQPTSSTTYSGEEIRRAPGSAGDVTRIIANLPSISKTDDQVNALAVRGGSPIENGFYLDNIEIPNINHFPRQGTSNGSLGLINVDLIKDVNFSAGGFSASYGNRLSSIMDLSFREGNRDEFDGQISFDMIGFGTVVEGPIDNGKGAWLLSARKSFLDLLKNFTDIELAPEINDYQGKIVFDINRNNRLSLLGVYGVSILDYTKTQAITDGNSNYAITDNYNYTFGLNWRHLWHNKGYSNTSVSLQGVKYGSEAFETKSDRVLAISNSIERQANFRNCNYYSTSDKVQIEFGFEGKYIYDVFDDTLGEYTNPVGDTIAASIHEEEFRSSKLAAFTSFIIHPSKRLTTTFGVRYDYFEYTSIGHISPRLSLSYNLSDRLTISGATGVYYQNHSPLILSQDENFKKLEDMVAYHYVIGLSHLIADDIKLTLEGYYKTYENIPIDSSLPQFFVLDVDNAEFNTNDYDQLVDEGEAESYGIEMTLQKKLPVVYTVLIGGSISKTRYMGLDGIWRDRVFDNQYIFSFEGGYKPSSKWEFSARWIVAGGRPYTPLNLFDSETKNTTVLDDNLTNEERYPVYHSLNIRADKRFYFEGSNLLIYLSLWNTYNQKNISTHYWNEIEQKPDEIEQWGLLPVLGIEFEF